MADCELLSNCIFFNNRMADMPSTSNIIKFMYCNDNFTGCARYMVRMSAGSAAVPDDLFPNQNDRAKEILAKL